MKAQFNIFDSDRQASHIAIEGIKIDMEKAGDNIEALESALKKLKLASE